MAVHFKKGPAQSSGQSSVADQAVQGQMQQLLGSQKPDLGLYGNFVRRSRERAISLAEETRKREVESLEGLATHEHAVSSQGIAIRTALSRVYGELIVAEAQAMGESHAAAVQAQKLAHMSASLANLLSKNEDIVQIRSLHASGQISADDATNFINQIIDAHVDAEERLAAMHQAVADTTDRVYQSGFAPVNHVIGKS